MSGTPQLTEALRQFLDRAIDDGLAPEEYAVLETELRENAAARDYYLRSTQLVSDTVMLLRAVESTDRAIASMGLPATSPSAGVERERQGLRGVFDRFARRVELRDHPWRFACIAGLGTAVAWMLLFSFIWPRMVRVQVAEPSVGDALPPVVARVLGTIEARFPAGQAAPVVGSHLRQGQSLDLVAGLLELEFSSGARVLLEGPARLQLDSDKQGILQSGRMTANVPQHAVGFTIETSRVRIVDLGTRFGVEVAPRKRTHVHVFEGAVELTRKAASGQMDGASVRLTTGQTWTLEPDVAPSESEALAAHRPFVAELPQAGQWPLADFEPPTYDVGQLAGQMNWNVAATENARVVDSENGHALYFRGIDGRRAASRSLAGWPLVRKGRGTLFFRVRPLDRSVNVGVGLSSQLHSNSWDDYEVQVVLFGEGAPLHLRGRDGNVFRDLTGELPADTWYSVWMLFDQTRELFDVYVQGGPFSERTRVGQDLRFRKGGQRTLRSLDIRTSTTDRGKGILIDDIYILPGTIHSDPRQAAAKAFGRIETSAERADLEAP